MESLDNQDIQNNIQEDPSPLEKAKKTPKPRSEKQMEHFKNLQQKRKEAIEKKKFEKKIEASKLLLEQDIPPAQPKQKKIIQGTGYQQPDKPSSLVSPPPSEDEEESDSSVEKIVVNVVSSGDRERRLSKKKPKKKKAKEIIIYNEDSDTEEEEERPSGTTFGRPELVVEQRSRYSDVEEEYKQQKRALKTQQNKKSKTKIYQQEQPQIFKSQSMNYFVD
jgi:hypothetical protein